ITDVLLLMRSKDTVQGITALMQEEGVLSSIPNLTPEQKQQFAAEYIPRLVNQLNSQEIENLGGNETAAAQALATGFGLGAYIELRLLEMNKRNEIGKRKEEAQEFLTIPMG
ncbi:MAG TPA: hypothetical protein DCM40_11510, partial [Maribacter sp.]|nr:hypothetical protein [Maribacter sp.]